MTDWKHCRECGNTCSRLQNEQKGEYTYCCNCVPANFITKPLKYWMCKACACIIHNTGWCFHNEVAERFEKQLFGEDNDS